MPYVSLLIRHSTMTLTPPILLLMASRHIYRDPSARPRLKSIDTLALGLAKEMLEKGWHASLTVPQEIFALMPFRHSPTIDR